MNKTLHLSLLYSLVTLPGAAVADPIVYQPVAPLKRIYSLYKSAETDQLLTDRADESGSWGGTSTIDVWYLEKEAQATTRPFYRLYKGLPQREHFYTADAVERDIVLSYGYVADGPADIIGHIYTTRLPGTVALHRLSRFDGTNGDLVHRYTVDNGVLNALIADGFVYESVAGYVYQSPTPSNPNGWVFGSRCATAGQTCNTNDPQHRNAYFNNFATLPQSVPLPTGSANTLTLRFNLWATGYFGDASTGASGDHFVITPRTRIGWVHNDLGQSALRGMGLAFGAAGFHCGRRSDLWFEQFWPVYGQSLGWSSYNYDVPNSTTRSTPNTCGGVDLRDGETYQVSIAVRSDGLARYTVTLGSTTVAQSVFYRRDVGASVPAFDAGGLATWLVNASTSTRNHTVYLNNVRYAWTTEDIPPPPCVTKTCVVP